MTKKSSKKSLKFGKILPYIVVATGIFAVAFFGSLPKDSNNVANDDIQNLISNNSFATVDQLSEFYTTATVADDINLATASVIRTNYESVSVIQDIGQNDTTKVVKPNLVDVSHLSRGVVSYVVKEGEDINSIANKYNISSTQIRWSNNLKTDEISVGQTLLVPTVPGIAYTVKEGDNVDSLAEKYKSSAQLIISLNDLEKDSTLKPGAVIILPNGELPETERPEYEVKTSTNSKYRSNASSSQIYSAVYASGNRYAYGWCTWYAWQWRHDTLGDAMPSNMGNASSWARAAAGAGYTVSRTPVYGAVFQTTGGSYYGHVGVVTGVNSDGTITISDMNGIAGWGRVGSKTIDQSEWSRYNYIYPR
ncbi:LysM peptidoglycan-binding domain-containing protein [Candidatus Saccharibacteria bacterium]|nr:LysM peptidoglycan-binding domain-containing protein [Candidatus Saccharibacteria bacterium]